MDLISAKDNSVLRRNKFRSLKLISNVDMEQPLGHEPSGLEFGRLDNGLSYYVRANSNPKMRAALALAVKAGSVLEEEHERGVAQIVQHLAFSATTNYTRHDIDKFRQIIEGEGECDACANAGTYSEETLYPLFVPVDNPDQLSQAISILAEFSTEIRIAAEDLERERGAIMEDYRDTRNGSVRRLEANWALMMEGSKYAQRLPFGTETVLGTVSAETVRQFYKKWYNLRNMAVLAVGDFPDTQCVVELIKTHFGKRSSPLDPPLIPLFEVPSHEEPRFSSFLWDESDSGVMIRFLMPASKLKTVKDYRDLIVETFFMLALNLRLSEIYSRQDPPFFSCSAEVDGLTRTVKAYIMTSNCKAKGTIEALESMLTELARIRLHGFTEREISLNRAWLVSAFEAIYVERDHIQSTRLSYDYLQHFLIDKPVVGIEFEAQLHKTLLPSISSSEVAKYAEKCRTSCNCLISAYEPQATLTIDDMKTVVSKITSLEDERSIAALEEEYIPEDQCEELWYSLAI